ncbi:hypothetical protein ACMXYY_04455 [Acinetobacter courvalinii]|uniref:hypothetical protein n=2 Tax=Acinetobacter courvalinii TaxID=280147 RepID=UPI0028A1C80B|nr:hypothetical protein [Acinetobacter courvalinii]
MPFISQKIQKIFQNQFMHNQVTLENIKAIRQLLDEQPTPDTLIHRLKHWQGEQNLYIRNYLYWALTTLSLIFLLAGLLFSGYYLIVCVALFALGLRYRIPTIELENLKQELRLYLLEQTYQVRFDHENTPLTHALQDHPLFQLGDKDNTVTTLLTGQMLIKQKTYDYSVIKYHYTYLTKTTDDQGREVWETTHCDLWGVLMENFPYKGVSISAAHKSHCHLGIEWQSSDIRFNQKYQQSGISEFEFVKFLTPERLLALEQMMQAFHGDFYVDPHTGLMCWLFNESPLAENNYLFQAMSINELAEKLEQLQMPKLQRLQDAFSSLLKTL